MELLLKPNIRNYYQEFIDNWFSKLKDFSFYFNEKYCYVLWQNHWRKSKKYWRNSNQPKTRLRLRWIWRNSKHHSNKWESNQKEFTTVQFKKCNYLNTIGNLPQNQRRSWRQWELSKTLIRSSHCSYSTKKVNLNKYWL